MYEIELKAHVDDRQALIKKLESFAYFSGAVEKDDTYYGKTVEGRQIQVRIRKETPFTPKELDLPEVSIDSQKTVIFTYTSSVSKNSTWFCTSSAVPRRKPLWA